MSAEPDLIVKVIIIGDSGVGKTNILSQLCEFRYNQAHVATVGVDFRAKTLKIENKSLRLQIWDTAGQERFRTVTKSYYKGAEGVIICYSCIDRQSFENVEVWMKSLMENQTKPSSIVIISTKCDLTIERDVLEDEGKKLAEQWKVPFFETSAKDGTNIQESFQCLGVMMKQRLCASDNTMQISSNNYNLNTASKTKKQKECCS